MPLSAAHRKVNAKFEKIWLNLLQNNTSAPISCMQNNQKKQSWIVRKYCYVWVLFLLPTPTKRSSWKCMYETRVERAREKERERTGVSNVFSSISIYKFCTRKNNERGRGIMLALVHGFFIIVIFLIRLSLLGGAFDDCLDGLTVGIHTRQAAENGTKNVGITELIGNIVIIILTLWRRKDKKKTLWEKQWYLWNEHLCMDKDQHAAIKCRFTVVSAIYSSSSSSNNIINNNNFLCSSILLNTLVTTHPCFPCMTITKIIIDVSIGDVKVLSFNSCIVMFCVSLFDQSMNTVDSISYVLFFVWKNKIARLSDSLQIFRRALLWSHLFPTVWMSSLAQKK